MLIWDNKVTQIHKVAHKCFNVSIKNLDAGALSTELLNFCDINLRKKLAKPQRKQLNTNLFYKRSFPWFTEDFLVSYFIAS